jgi:hypothetical protein
MQVNKSQLNNQKKQQEKILKIPLRPVSAAAAPNRNDFTFRFNSKIKVPQK